MNPHFVNVKESSRVKNTNRKNSACHVDLNTSSLNSATPLRIKKAWTPYKTACYKLAWIETESVTELLQFKKKGIPVSRQGYANSGKCEYVGLNKNDLTYAHIFEYLVSRQ